jgi:hypothetical protein
VVAAILAAFCVLTSVEGSAILAIATAIVVYLLPRRTVSRTFAEFVPWLFYTLAFAIFSILWMRLTPHNGTVLGLVVFSPVFGTVVFIFERVVASTFSR